jgi:peptide/nickel transport system substrate-binding protein
MRKISITLSFLVVFSLLIAACQPQAATATEPAIGPTAAGPTATEAPTEEPVAPTPEPTTRRGGWLDEITISVVGADSVITQLQAGAIDLYTSGLASRDLPAIQDAGLKSSVEIGGTFYELTYNPYGPIFDGTGKLNPFAVAKVREAMNWLVDRNYLNQEVYAGGGLPKFFSIVTNYPDYADLADVVRPLESKYAYNPDMANEVISAEMETLGAELVDGKWTYEGEPVTIIMLIRTDHDGTRVPIGDYVASQLESIGFTVDRQYKTSSEASPIWVGGNVADGLFHIYTGAWGATVIDRDQGDNFQFYSTSQSAYSFTTLWQNYACGEEFDEMADDLAYNRFTSLDERRETFGRILEMDIECGLRTWLIDGASYAPFNQNVEVTYDIAAGIGNGALWPYTIRLADQEGGSLKVGQPDLFVDPWNPIAGSNWSFDGSVQRATQSYGVVFDPHTGLTWPQRIERAEVTVQEGLPVGVTHDWLTLDFEAEIAVPEDALVDWDAENQVFITAAEKFPEGTTAQVKSVVYYPLTCMTLSSGTMAAPSRSGCHDVNDHDL